MGIGDWGLGIGDWGVGPIPNAQYPIPHPPSPNPLFHFLNNNKKYNIIIKNKITKIYKKIILLLKIKICTKY